MSDGVAVTGVLDKYSTRPNGDMAITITIDASQIDRFNQGFSQFAQVALVRMADGAVETTD